MTAEALSDRLDGGFSHEALFYAGSDEFVERVAAFVREGVAAGEPVLVMVTADKVEMLRAELGHGAAEVTFVDMGEAGRNPGRIISAWADFAAEHRAEGRALRGIGEPVWAGRSHDELVECQHHESLINLAFGDVRGFRLMCPYDTDALPLDVIAEARTSHPHVLDDAGRHACHQYRGLDAVGQATDTLAPPRAASFEMGFRQRDLDRVRLFAREQAADADLTPARTDDFVVAVNEAATNSIRHGGGTGVVRMWQHDGAVVAEIRDRGRVTELLAGRTRPEPLDLGGHGLWLVHQLCDLVQLRTRRHGTVVRLHMSLGPAA